jgi:hypothetical protein
MVFDLFLNVSPLAGVGHVGLSLPELGQVEGGNLLRLLNLLLVAPDLGLQLINQTLNIQNKLYILCSFFKGTLTRDFLPLFFSSNNFPWVPDTQVKAFRIWLRIREDNRQSVIDTTVTGTAVSMKPLCISQRCH